MDICCNAEIFLWQFWENSSHFSLFFHSNFKKEFKQIVPCLFVKISTHRDLKNPKNFLNSLNQRNNGKSGVDENLIRNGEKTMQETTLIQPNNDNIMISIETDVNDVHANDANNHHKQHRNEHENGKDYDNKRIRINDNNLMVIKGCDEITSDNSDRTSSRTNDTSIS